MPSKTMKKGTGGIVKNSKNIGNQFKEELAIST